MKREEGSERGVTYFFMFPPVWGIFQVAFNEMSYSFMSRKMPWRRKEKRKKSGRGRRFCRRAVAKHASLVCLRNLLLSDIVYVGVDV